MLEERFNLNRTISSLEFMKKQAMKTSDKKQAKKTVENMDRIREYLLKNGKSKTNDIAKYIGLSSARTNEGDYR